MKRSTLPALVSCLFLALTVSACERSPSDGGDHTIGELRVFDLDGNPEVAVATWTHGGSWIGSLPDIRIATNQPLRLRVRIFSRSGQERTLQLGGEYSAQWALGPGAPTGIIAADDSRGPRFHGDRVHIHPLAPGETRIQFLLMHGDHADGATSVIPIRVAP